MKPPIFTLFLLPLFFIPSFSSQVSISLSTTTLSKSGDPVTIHWSGVDSPTKLDWLGIYSPPNSTHPNFLGYLFLSTSPTYQSGSGSLTLPLINLRSNYQFRIFRWLESETNKHLDHDQNQLPMTKHLLAVSQELGFELGRGPEQVHLALTGKPDEMRVMFVTHDGKESSVRYGLARDLLDQVVGTKVGRYEREDMCDAPANQSLGWRDPGFIHDGVMTNLKNGRRYFYKVGSDSGGWSTTYTFVSQGGDSSETNAFLFGDMGAAAPYTTFHRTQLESIATIKWINRDIEALGDKPAFISHIGDISYARGFQWMWDQFFYQIEPVASKAPYHVCIGNHEYNWPLQPWKPDWSVYLFGKDGGGECGVPYSLRFNMPGNSSEPTNTRAPPTRNLYYSVDVGVVHFVFISTETNFLSGSKQYNFLKRDLESVDRKKTPFVVVQGHRPMYTTSNELRDNPIREKLLEHLEPLLVKNNVTLALWGHVHRYERFCPLSNFTCGSAGLPVHVVIGMAGQDWQPIWEPRANHPDLPVFPQPDRSLYRGGEFGYTKLYANREKLTFSYIGNHDGEVHDMVEIFASGDVVNGYQVNNKIEDLKGKEVGFTFSWYVKGASVLVLGAFIGYVIGFVSHAQRRKTWTAVKSEEI